jgi:diadenosine tetraphosphate (Ap4A) HIT family hydrolase
VAGKAPAYKFWEDENYVAFLSIFPNTLGFTLVVPKKHYDSNVFKAPEEVVNGLMKAARNAADLLETKLEDVGRSGIMFEGTGVNHLHAKVFPMHGTKSGDWIKSAPENTEKYFKLYEGYITSCEGPRADDGDLKKLAEKLRS